MTKGVAVVASQEMVRRVLMEWILTQMVELAEQEMTNEQGKELVP